LVKEATSIIMLNKECGYKGESGEFGGIFVSNHHHILKNTETTTIKTLNQR
jgi:hypothetical protein